VKVIIVMKHQASTAEVEQVLARVKSLGYKAHLSQGEERTVIGVIGDDRPIDPGNFAPLEGVERVLPVLKPFKLASREMHPQDSLVDVDGLTVGGSQIVIMAGPCSIEDRHQMLEIAHAVKESGAAILRGGAFKPRTSPYSFQGLGERGLELLAEAKQATGLRVITEAMSPEQIPLVAQCADIIQLGARSMQNYELLRAAGDSGRPVLLKRGLMATIEEWLMSAEYLLSVGNQRVILCERGIRSIERYTRNTTDINAIPVVKELSHLPVILDPSHSTGQWQYVSAVARAGVAAGADGLLVEVHPRPEEALSDGAQSLRPERFAEMVRQVRDIASAVGRELLEAEWTSKTPA
jgi:3-deoxy-7-phosphoheptulonate synthase